MENKIDLIFESHCLKILEENNELGILEYTINDDIEITKIEYEDKYLSMLIDKLIMVTYYLNKSYIYFGEKNLSSYHFLKEGECYYLNHDTIKIKRFVKVGDGITGAKNNLCDVEGVRVSHFTVQDKEEYNTGLTIISPHPSNIFREKVVGASYVYNGFGKSTGLVQIDELGTIETNIVLTTTLNVGKIVEAVAGKAIDENPEIGISTGTVNPIVLECNDGSLNNSRNRILGRLSYLKGLEDLSTDFKQGSVGAGTGMICHGFKGGIGSSSRIINIDGKEYTIGVLVNSNFGDSNGKSLIFNGHKLGDKIKEYLLQEEEKGSIIVVIGTDLPLSDRQLKRVLKRAEIGIGRTGSYAGNGSGDVFVGFSTENKVEHFNNKAINNSLSFNDNNISIVFKRTCEAVEEAIINSMLFSPHVKGYLKEIKSLNEVNQLFYQYLEEEIVYE